MACLKNLVHPSLVVGMSLLLGLRGLPVAVMMVASPAIAEVTCVALEPCWLLHVPSAAFDALESGLTPEAAVFRRGVIDSMAAQLR